MATIFTKIIKGELPCHKVAESENYLAFLDINPLAKGHTLAISKKEIDYLFDLETETYSGLMVFAKKVAVAIRKVIECKRIGVAVVGIEVPHAHIHLIPINGIYDIEFSRPRLKLTQEELKDIAANIAREFQS